MGSKDELLTKICFHCAQEYVDGMTAIDVEGGTPDETDREVIKLDIHIGLFDKSSVSVFNDEWKRLQEPFLSKFLELRRIYETAYLRIIREGITTGAIKQMDPYLVYQMVLSSL